MASEYVDTAKLKRILRERNLTSELLANAIRHHVGKIGLPLSLRTLRSMLNNAEQRFAEGSIAALAAALSVSDKPITVADLVRRKSTTRRLQPRAMVTRVARGVILSPGDGAILNSRQIEVRVKLQDVPNDFSVWLVVAKNGLHWPKAPGVSLGGMWRGQFFEGGPVGERFALLLWAVGPRGTRQIQRWLRECGEKDKYPGLSMVSDISPLHQVRGLELNLSA